MFQPGQLALHWESFSYLRATGTLPYMTGRNVFGRRKVRKDVTLVQDGRDCHKRQVSSTVVADRASLRPLMQSRRVPNSQLSSGSFGRAYSAECRAHGSTGSCRSCYRAVKEPPPLTSLVQTRVSTGNWVGGRGSSRDSGVVEPDRKRRTTDTCFIHCKLVVEAKDARSDMPVSRTSDGYSNFWRVAVRTATGSDCNQTWSQE